MSQYDQELEIQHWPKNKKNRPPFKARTLKPGVILPERQFFVQLVKFAPGKGPKDFTNFYNSLDKKLAGMYNQKYAVKSGKTRCDGMDIHEIVSFVTWGAYDMVVLWDAPNMTTANEFLAAWIDPSDYGTSTTLPVGVVPLHV